VEVFKNYYQIIFMQLVNLNLSHSKSKIYKVVDENFLENSFIVYNKVFGEVLYNPYCAGISLQNKMQKVGIEFSKLIKKLCFKDSVDKKTITELVFLSGGLFYNLNYGFKKNFNFSLPQCFLGIARYHIPNTLGDYQAKIDYTNFEALLDNANIIIGDTLATGATLSTGIEYLINYAQKENKSINSIVFVTLAGSKKGAIVFKNILKKYGLEKKSSIIFANQVFHLMENGTDLRFFGPDAIVSPEAEKETLKRYGENLGYNFKCAVFDWGTRCKNPLKHYVEFKKEVEKLLSATKSEHDKKILTKLIQKADKEAKAYLGKL